MVYGDFIIFILGGIDKYLYGGLYLVDVLDLVGLEIYGEFWSIYLL